MSPSKTQKDVTVLPGRQARRRRLLTYRGAIVLVIANMIGTGVFTTSGFALADLRDASFVMLAWLVGGLYAFSGVAIYSDLAKSYPESGGEYVFLKHLLHPALGTAAGWVSLVAGFTVPIAVAGLGAELYLGRAFSFSLADPWIATAMILCLGLIHALAPEKGVVFQNSAVLIKVCVIVAFIGFGATIIAGAPAPAPAPAAAKFSLLAFAGSLVWISYAYSGWNAAVYVTEEVEGGGEITGRALAVGTLLVTALYLGVSAVILYGAPQDELSGVAESGAVAARALGGANAEKALSCLIALALLTSASSMILSGPRVYARMARDGVLPAMLGRLHGDYPRMAILAQAALSLLVVWAAGLRELLQFAGVTLSLSAGAVAIGWFRQEARSPHSSLRLLKAGAGLFFLAATGGIAIATMVMRPASTLAATILICWGLVAHVWGSNAGAAPWRIDRRP
jgi:APA family basic amino acid/polyamine antiporter